MDSGGGALHLPPGFRFHPTDDELVRHYLLRKCGGGAPAAPVIAEVDLYKFDPWQLPAKSLVGEKEWYFFSPRDRKYPNGSRPNRAAGTGYWKATGADKPVGAPRAVAIKKALVFYAGKPPKGVKTNWIMHEYRLADVDRSAAARKRTSSNNNALRLDDWVLCRIYNKKGVLERYDTVDDDEVMMTNKPPVAAKNDNNNARGGHAAAAPAAAMKVEMHDYDGYYAAVDDYDMPEAAEMLCFDRPFQPPPPLSSSGDRDSGDDNSVPRLLHTDNSSSGSEHVLSPSPDLPDRDRDHAESQPIMAAGGGWFDGCWGGDGAAHDDGFVVDCALFGSMPSPGGFASARDAAALGEMFAYLQRPF